MPNECLLNQIKKLSLWYKLVSIYNVLFGVAYIKKNFGNLSSLCNSLLRSEYRKMKLYSSKKLSGGYSLPCFIEMNLCKALVKVVLTTSWLGLQFTFQNCLFASQRATFVLGQVWFKKENFTNILHVRMLQASSISFQLLCQIHMARREEKVYDAILSQGLYFVPHYRRSTTSPILR